MTNTDARGESIENRSKVEGDTDWKQGEGVREREESERNEMVDTMAVEGTQTRRETGRSERLEEILDFKHHSGSRAGLDTCGLRLSSAELYNDNPTYISREGA